MQKHNAKLNPLIPMPLGSDRFRDQVEAALGRRIGLRARGRREAEPSNAALPGQMGLDL